MLFVCPSVLLPQDITRNVHRIDEVVVWGKRPMKDIGVQKTKFDSLALKENIALSMADILTFNSSVFVKSYGRATLSTVAFRGTSPSHTQVTWNGMRINNPMLGMTDFSSIPSYFIDEASLLHGTSSVNETGGGLAVLSNSAQHPMLPMVSMPNTFRGSVRSVPSTNLPASHTEMTGGMSPPVLFTLHHPMITNILTTTRKSTSMTMKKTLSGSTTPKSATVPVRSRISTCFRRCITIP